MPAKKIKVMLNIPQGKFLQLPHKFRGFVGGFGCLRGSTQVVTANGPVPIDSIDRPTLLLSLDEKSGQLELCQGGPSFPKGKDYLYRIATTQGEFVASGSHRIFDAHGEYQSVRDLSVGQELHTSFQDLLLTKPELAPLGFLGDDLCSIETGVGCQGGYEDVTRLRGPQPHQEEYAGLSYSPLQVDVQVYDQGSSLMSLRHKDAQGEQTPQRIHPCLSCAQKQKHHLGGQQVHLVEALEDQTCSLSAEHILTDNQPSLICHEMLESHRIDCGSHLSDPCFDRSCDFQGQTEHHVDGVEDSTLTLPVERMTENTRQAEISLFLSDSHLNTKQPFVPCSFDNSFCLEDSYTNTKTATIIHIKREEVKEVYWDIQVSKNHNYLTVDGSVHHNSGKTYTGSIGMCQHFYQHPGITQGYFAPTYPHIRDIYYPTIEEVAFNMGLDVEIREGNKEVHFYSGKQYRGTAICRSMDKPHNIIGFKIGHAMVDEFDVLPTDKAQAAWSKIIARMRYNVHGVKNGVDVTTTPEGFRFTHKLFVEMPEEKPDLKKNYGLVQASTYDNAKHLNDDYISSLYENYPEELRDAYLNGKFVNLTSGTVYRNYDKKRCNSAEEIKDKEPLYIGMDFNVANMSAVACVKREGNIHAVAELIGVYDTPEIVRIIQERWQSKGHKIFIYPDASGKARKTVDASVSDIALLERAGFSLRYHSKNPYVKDRIISMNSAFSKGKLFVNSSTCKDTSSCLQRLAYDKNGEPDKKSGFDHRPDALGYLVYYEMPVIKPGITSKIDMTY